MWQFIPLIDFYACFIWMSVKKVFLCKMETKINSVKWYLNNV